MTLGDLRLGMSLNLDDPAVISRYKIRNIRSAISDSGRAFKQFAFGPSMFDTEDMHVTEGIWENGYVDSLMKIWVLPYRTEEEMQKIFQGLSAMFGEMHDKHLKQVKETQQCTTVVQRVFSHSLVVGVEAYPDNMAMAVQHAIMMCVQLGQRIMARVIFCEENDLNTGYTLELYPAASKFQLTKLITFRN
jgi:hypothetical protein